MIGCIDKCRKKKERKPDFRQALRSCILKDLGIKEPKTDREVDEDPFRLLGYGVNSYFDFMYYLMKMFLAITILMIPVYCLYAGNDEQGLKSFHHYRLNQFSLGNMGGAQAYCMRQRFKFETMKLRCPAG